MNRLVLPIFFLLCSLVTPIVSVVLSVQFGQECSGYLKQAADANSVEISLERLNKAVAYIESHGLVIGYTSVLWKTEDENIGFWYRNIKACQRELVECQNKSQLEKTNVLMKVRESLIDDGEKGTVLTIPDGIHKYPSNGMFAVFNLLSVFGIIGCLAWLKVELEEL